MGGSVGQLFGHLVAVRRPAGHLKRFSGQRGDERREEDGSQRGRGHHDKPLRPCGGSGRETALVGEGETAAGVGLKRPASRGERDTRVLRVNSCWPTLCSSAAMRALTDGWVRRSTMT